MKKMTIDRDCLRDGVVSHLARPDFLRLADEITCSAGSFYPVSFDCLSRVALLPKSLWNASSLKRPAL